MKVSKRLSAAALAAELARLSAAQEVMREANAALATGDLATLHVLGFTAEHVEHLQKPTTAGTIGFPSYAFTNNQMTIGAVERALKQTRRSGLTWYRGGRVSEPRAVYRVSRCCAVA